MLRLLSSLLLCVGLAHAQAAEPEKELSISLKIARRGDFLGYGFGSIWMMSGAKLVRVNPEDNSFSEKFIRGSLGKFRGYQVGAPALWLPDIAADRLFKIDPRNGEAILSIPAQLDEGAGSMGVGLGSLWVVEDAIDKKLLVRRDDTTGNEQAKIVLPAEGDGVWVAFGSVWVTSNKTAELYRIDPAQNVVAQTIVLKPRPRFMTADENAIWVVDQGGYIQRINGRSGVVEATIEIGTTMPGGDIDVGGGYIWATSRNITLLQVDPKTNSIVGRYHADNVGAALRFGAGSIWISGPELNRINLPQ